MYVTDTRSSASEWCKPPNAFIVAGPANEPMICPTASISFSSSRRTGGKMDDDTDDFADDDAAH